MLFAHNPKILISKFQIHSQTVEINIQFNKIICNAQKMQFKYKFYNQINLVNFISFGIFIIL
jgi:hypothetical protein